MEEYVVVFRRKSGEGFHVEKYASLESAEFARNALNAGDPSIGATVETLTDDPDAE